MFTRLIRVVAYCKELQINNFGWPVHEVSTCRKSMETKLGKLRLPSLNPHRPLIAWEMWSQATIWKIYISTIIRLTASKLGRVLTYGRRFRTQMLRCHQVLAFLFLLLGVLTNWPNLHSMFYKPDMCYQYFLCV